MPTAFDTLSYAKKLQRAGFSEEQAEVLTELRSEIEQIKSSLETREEIRELRRKLMPVEILAQSWPMLVLALILLILVIVLIAEGVMR